MSLYLLAHGPCRVAGGAGRNERLAALAVPAAVQTPAAENPDRSERYRRAHEGEGALPVQDTEQQAGGQADKVASDGKRPDLRVAPGLPPHGTPQRRTL
jgi:hypothetical protein